MLWSMRSQRAGHDLATEQQQQPYLMGFSGGSDGKACLPTLWEIWVQSLGQEDRLEKGMATHSCTIAWKIPWMEEPDELQSMGSQRVGHD